MEFVSCEVITAVGELAALHHAWHKQGKRETLYAKGETKHQRKPTVGGALQTVELGTEICQSG